MDGPQGKLDLFVRHNRNSRGWAYAIDIYRDLHGNGECFHAEPIEIKWRNITEDKNKYLIPEKPSLVLSEKEWEDLRGVLTDPMRMHGIAVSSITVETSIKEVRAHLETVKNYADRMLRILESRGQ